MIHPIFVVALRRPDLLATHVSNYGELLKSELVSVGSSLAIRAASAAVALVALLLALGLSGVAVMLGMVQGTFHWVLAIVPGVAWLLMLVSVAILMRPTVRARFDEIKDQFQADCKILSEVMQARHD